MVLTTLLTLVGCDQKTKSLAKEHLRGGERQSLLADTLRLDYTENQGAFLSIGASLPTEWRLRLFTIGCSAGIGGILLYTLLTSQSGALGVLALSLVCAGGIGNLIDRWLYEGYVRDFLNIGIGSVRTGIFNVADVSLLTGCILLLFRTRGG